MLSLCPRPRCALTELHLTRAGSGSSPALAPLSKARAIARARISWANGNLVFSFSNRRLTGADGAHPPSNLPGTCARPPPPSPPRLPDPNAHPNLSPNQARAVPPSGALEGAAVQLERSEAMVAEARRSEAVRRLALPHPYPYSYPYPYPYLYPYTPSPSPSPSL